MKQTNDNKTFLEKWRDFWFWIDPLEFIELALVVSILTFTVSGNLVILRLVGLI